MEFKEEKKEPNPNCELCEGEGIISQSGYDDSDLYVHFGSVECDCTKEMMSRDDVIYQRLKRLEKDPGSTILWKDIKRD
jgi:hypothetical protein